MPVIDHVFICTSPDAPAADLLRQFGLQEGPPNRHPGQGTACRRFFFRNAMLELLWVEDAGEARSEQTRRTGLWERWPAAGNEASPFGIILRPESASPEPCPFPSWEYRPPTMPDLALQIASEAGLEEPMWCFMEAFGERLHPAEHPAGFRNVTTVRIVSPPLKKDSVTRTMAKKGLIGFEPGAEHLLELEFDGRTAGRQIDFRPELPLRLHW